MLKAGSISCWNEKQNMESYMPANKHSRFDFNLVIAYQYRGHCNEW